MLFYNLPKLSLLKVTYFSKIWYVTSAPQAERCQCQYVSTTLQLAVGYKCKSRCEYWRRTIHTKNPVELVNCKQTDRCTDTGIHVYAHK
jgi:uncharacterized membrane protein